MKENEEPMGGKVRGREEESNRQITGTSYRRASWTSPVTLKSHHRVLGGEGQQRTLSLA